MSRIKKMFMSFQEQFDEEENFYREQERPTLAISETTKENGNNNTNAKESHKAKSEN